jgi:hypothetical protein
MQLMFSQAFVIAEVHDNLIIFFGGGWGWDYHRQSGLLGLKYYKILNFVSLREL